jgi:hypothetical protein
MSSRVLGARPRSRSGSGAVRVRRVLALAGCGVLGVGLSACESTEQESAKIGRESVSATQAEQKQTKHAGHAAGHSHHHGHGSTHGSARKGSS